MTTSRSSGEQTRALNPPVAPGFSQVPLATPIHRATTFEFASATEYAAVLGGTAEGYCYSRIDNPTADGFAAAVAALEAVGMSGTAPGRDVPGDVLGDVLGQPFASGMAAISTTLLALTSAGAHVVAPREIYGGTFSLLVRQLARFGVTTTFADTTDPAAVAAAMTPATAVVWAEAIANPTLSVADVSALAAVAHAGGAQLVVDATFASPAVVRPLALGADVSLHSATKYLGGHSDATGGVVSARRELIAPIRLARVDFGGSLAPDEAYLLARGLQTLPLRVARHSETALALAGALEGHAGLARVDYPGLPSHRDHALASKIFTAGRYGGMLTLTPHGDRADGMAFCDRLRLIRVATSLGGTHSLVSHVASTTHRQLSDAELAAAGIGPAAVRLSVGLEDAEDLLADIVAALG